MKPYLIRTQVRDFNLERAEAIPGRGYHGPYHRRVALPGALL